MITKMTDSNASQPRTDPNGETVATATISPTPAAPKPGNDNAVAGGIPDTTPLVARPEIVRAIRAALRGYHVTPQDMADAIADVQVESIEAARKGAMPRGLT